MRPAISRAVLWMSVLSILVALCAFEGLTFAQTTSSSKHKLLQQTLDLPSVATSLTLARPANSPARKIGPSPETTTTDTWTGGGGSGNTNWSDTSNWNNGSPSGQNVLINLTTAATVDDNVPTIGTLTLSNAGDSVALGTGNTLTVNGNIINNGTIYINSPSYGATLSIGASLTLSGAGTVQLTCCSNSITGATGAVLTNQSTIEGAGTVGDGVIGLVNAGTINANAGTLSLQPGVASTNTGTLEATNGSTLQFNGGTWKNTGGTITAATGSTVLLINGVSITGGTLTTSGTGLVENGSGSSAYLTNVTNKGTYDITTSSDTVISGTITNNGTINLTSTSYGSGLSVSTSATLAGTGAVVLQGGSNWVGGATGAILTNEETIEGVGNVGNAQLALVNSGTMNANVSGNTLTLQPGAASTNTGMLEATNGGTLQFNGGSWTNTGGTITAATGSTVLLINGVSITGGTLTTSGTGVVENGGESVAYLTNVTNNGTYDITTSSNTVISGTITNNGTINLTSTSYGSGLSVTTSGSQSATLAGTGSVVLGGNSDYISGGSSSTLTIDQTIVGVGNVGEGELTLINNNAINANVSPTVNNTPLYVQPGAGGLTNSSTGILEATNGGTLVLNGGTITNSGTIEALGSDSSGNPSTVELTNVSITGGTLATSGTGVIENIGGVAYLTNVTNNGTYDIGTGNDTVISGTITNNGTINLISTSYGSELSLGANTTLKGTGAVVLDGSSNYISGASGTVLTNDSTVKGAGNIGNQVLKLVNNGTINANSSGGTLVLQPGAASTNTKTMEATGGGTLEFAGGSWTNTGGTITAGTGSTVLLVSGVSITGGTLTTSGTGLIEGNGAYLTNVTNKGTYDIQTGNDTVISGTITNNGTINLISTSYGSELSLGANTTLKGTGAVVLDGGSNYITGASGLVLTNDSTIEGAGNLGNSALTITNNGTIDANVSGGTLAILPGSGGFTNYNGTTNTLTGGTYIANAGNITFAGSTTGITTLSASVTEENGGQLIDTNGSINALNKLTSITSTGSLTTDVSFTDPGSFSNAGSLTILKGTTFNVQSLAQISGNTLTAGTYVLDANLGITGTAQNITTNAANLTLAGGTIENTSNSTNALAELATNSGSLTLASDATYTTAGNFSNTGTLTVDKGSSFTVTGTLAQISGSTLSSGTFVLGGNLDVGSGISITTNAATLTLEGGTIESGASNALANLASNTGSLTLADDASFTSAGNFTNSGALTIDSGSTFTVTGTLTNLSSGTLSGGTYTVAGTMQLASANGGITTNAANLILSGAKAKILDGTTNALAGFDNNTGSLTLTAAATLTTASSNFTNSGTVDVATGGTLTVGGTGTSYNQSAGTTTVDGTLAGAVNVTGGTIQGAGTLKGNVAVGGGGTAPTLHAGNAGVAGLLKITGTYTQLSTGTLNATIGGTVVGTQYSQLKVTGAASLSGTLTVNLINGFVPAVGKIFTILTAGSISGTFSTQYIGINGSEYFKVSYTATGVVLTVESGAPPSSTGRQTATVARIDDERRVLNNGLRRRVSGGELAHLVAAVEPSRGSWGALAERHELEGRIRRPYHLPDLPIWRAPARPVAFPQTPVVRFADPILRAANNWTATNPNHVVSPRLPMASGWQRNEVHGTAMKALLPLLRAR